MLNLFKGKITPGYYWAREKTSKKISDIQIVCVHYTTRPFDSARWIIIVSKFYDVNPYDISEFDFFVKLPFSFTKFQSEFKQHIQ